MTESTGDEAPGRRPVSLLQGGVWLVFVGLLQHAVTVVTFLVVARMVAPDQIGLISLVMAFVGAGAILSEFGISAALVQTRDLSQRYVDTAFTFSVALTLLLAGCLVAAAPLIAAFYENEQLVVLVWLAATGMMLRGFFAPMRGLVLRAQAYRQLAQMEFVGALAGSLATVVLVLGTRDVASLLYGQIVEATILLAVGAIYARPLPRSIGIREGRRSILAFGSTVSFSRALDQVAGTFDVLLIGKLFAASALGYFYTGQRITNLLPQLVVSKLQQLMFPHFSRHQDDARRLHDDYWTAVLVSGLAVGWICTLTIACAEPAVLLFLGETWRPTVPYIWIFSLAMLIQGLGGGVVGAFIFGTGRVHLTVWLSVFRIITLPTCIVVGSSFGPIGVAWAIVAYQAIGRVFSQFFVTWRCGLSIRPAARIVFQAALPVASGLVPAFAFDALVPDGSMGALAVLIPLVSAFFLAGAAISLFAFHDARTVGVRTVLVNVPKKWLIPV